VLAPSPGDWLSEGPLALFVAELVGEHLVGWHSHWRWFTMGRPAPRLGSPTFAHVRGLGNQARTVCVDKLKRRVFVGSRVIAAAVLSVVLGVSACTSPMHVGPPSSSNTSPPSSSPSASSSPAARGAVLRGLPVTSFACPPNLIRAVGGVPVPLPASDVTEFLLCPMPFPQHSRAVRVIAGNVHFGLLLRALTAPDLPPSTGLCPMYADAVQVILAKTRTVVMRAAIPVDGCGHYQHVDVLTAARAS
jgi:hypothetical protein